MNNSLRNIAFIILIFCNSKTNAKIIDDINKALAQLNFTKNQRDNGQAEIDAYSDECFKCFKDDVITEMLDPERTEYSIIPSGDAQKEEREIKKLVNELPFRTLKITFPMYRLADDKSGYERIGDLEVCHLDEKVNLNHDNSVGQLQLNEHALEQLTDEDAKTMMEPEIGIFSNNNIQLLADKRTNLQKTIQDKQRDGVIFTDAALKHFAWLFSKNHEDQRMKQIELEDIFLKANNANFAQAARPVKLTLAAIACVGVAVGICTKILHNKQAEKQQSKAY